MEFHLHCNMFCFFALFLLFGGGAFGQLSSNYYETTCPRALSTIKTAVNNAVSKEHRMGASLLRLHFHDCFINVCSLSLSLFTHTYTQNCKCTCTLPLSVEVTHTYVTTRKMSICDKLLSINMTNYGKNKLILTGNNHLAGNNWDRNNDS